MMNEIKNNIWNKNVNENKKLKLLDWQTNKNLGWKKKNENLDKKTK